MGVNLDKPVFTEEEIREHSELVGALMSSVNDIASTVVGAKDLIAELAKGLRDISHAERVHFRRIEDTQRALDKQIVQVEKIARMLVEQTDDSFITSRITKWLVAGLSLVSGILLTTVLVFGYVVWQFALDLKAAGFLLP